MGESFHSLQPFFISYCRHLYTLNPMKYQMKIQVLCAITCLLFCFSCNQKEKTHFFVTYTGLDAVNGSVAYLWRYSGDEMTSDLNYGKGPIGRAVVTDGQVGFAGPEDTTHLYRIEVEDASVSFYPEHGRLALTHTRPSEQPVSPQSSNPHSLNVQLWNLMHAEVPSSEQNRKMLFANIQNAVGCYLLNRSAMVYPEELEELYGKSNKEMLEYTPVLKTLRSQLYASRLIEQGDCFIDFKQADEKGDTIQFADIVGKGQPVALFFWMDNSERLPLWDEINHLRALYPGIQPVVVTIYFHNPSSIEFISELRSKQQAIILDDSYRFEESVRRLYRIHNTNYNYVYLFGGDGKLIKKQPVRYLEKEHYLVLETALMSAFCRLAGNENKSLEAYNQLSEYKAFKQFLHTHPGAIDMLLDGGLLKAHPNGLNGLLMDDLVKTFYPGAPSIVSRFPKTIDSDQQIAAIVQQYIWDIRTLISRRKMFITDQGLPHHR